MISTKQRFARDGCTAGKPMARKPMTRELCAAHRTMLSVRVQMSEPQCSCTLRPCCSHSPSQRSAQCRYQNLRRLRRGRSRALHCSQHWQRGGCVPSCLTSPRGMTCSALLSFPLRGRPAARKTTKGALKRRHTLIERLPSDRQAKLYAPMLAWWKRRPGCGGPSAEALQCKKHVS